jgi:murein tripeptide amidase MpaA
MRRWAVVVGVAWASVAGVANAVQPDSDHHCDVRVVRVEVADRTTLEWIASWTEPWEVAPDGHSAVLGVDEGGLRRLQAFGVPTALDPDRTAEICAPTVADLKQTAGIPGFPCYRTLEEGYRRAARMAERHPSLVEWIDLGDSWEKQASSGEVGFDLRLLRLTNREVVGSGAPGPGDGKPVLMVLAGVHAREFAPVEAVMRFAEDLVSGYGHDPDATWLLDEHEVHVVPFANPDGRTRAERLAPWRKNADNDFCPDTPTRGVDLNRNFAHEWGCCGGSSGEVCSEIFRGPSPASEPETRAYQTWMEQVFPDQWEPQPDADATGVFIDVHSYGRLVMWPWGNISELAPSWEGLEALGRRLAAKTGGTPQQSFELYPSDGTTDDYAYGRHGVAAFGFEIGDRFFEPCAAFERDVVGGAMAALRYAARVARTPYVTPGGPEVRDVAVYPRPDVPRGTPVVVRAVTDDTALAGRGRAVPTPIVETELWVGGPPWRNQGPPIVMTPVDDAWDAPIEAVEATLDTGSLPSGRHLVYLRARGEDGVWGPIGAALLWIDVAREPPRRVAPDARRAP